MSWIYLGRNSLASAGTVVRYGHGLPARTNHDTDGGLEESRRVNSTEMRVLDCEECRRTRNVSEVHARYSTGESSAEDSLDEISIRHSIGIASQHGMAMGVPA